jgi:hypothetical protein
MAGSRSVAGEPAPALNLEDRLGSRSRELLEAQVLPSGSLKPKKRAAVALVEGGDRSPCLLCQELVPSTGVGLELPHEHAEREVAA